MKVTLKAARINAGIDQNKAAEALEITRATLSNYENEKTAVPAKIFLKMTELYNVDTNSIFFAKQ